MDDNKNAQKILNREILNLIVQYLNEKSIGLEFEEEIATEVYYLFGEDAFKDCIEYYPFACSSALRAFALTDVAKKLEQEIGHTHYFYLCKMLDRMVKFCWGIRGNEMYLAQLDRLKWHTGKTYDLEFMSWVKHKYECLLKNVVIGNYNYRVFGNQEYTTIGNKST
ncbi:hypothetical protein [Longitalea luteola]|uniref:hypothetical protein n=1 Tax=Longitalea luteola TaxID=2812563 RepID=UPI001A973C40|nr:hypothetical protein [Longitalea luteola]